MEGSLIRLRPALALLACLTLLFAGPLPARDFFLQEGTEVTLQLHTTVDTEISQKNDRILCTVAKAVLIDNVEVIPEGSRVLGRIGDIKQPGRFGRKGQMVLTFDSIEVPGAGNVKISGSLVDIYDPEYEDHVTDEEMKELKGVSLGREGEVKGAAPSRLQQGLSMGGGAGLGAAAGGGVGAAVGVAVGAGVAFVWFKGKDVELPAGTGLIMRIDRGLTLNVPDMPQPAGNGK